jgi:hypothetical protein
MADKHHDGRPVSPERPPHGNTGRDIDAGRDKSAGDHNRPVPIEKVSNTVKPPTIPPAKPKG